MGRALVIGCGGTLGFAWTAAVLAELERQGWDPRTADVLIGTSAGAELGRPAGRRRQRSRDRRRLGPARRRAPLLLRSAGQPARPPRPGLPGLGLTRAALRRRVDLLAGLAGLLPRGSGDPQWLVDLGDSLAGADGWVTHPDTWLVAADARTGERLPFGRAGTPRPDLGHAIAASWAIPGWFPPVEVAGHALLDGGAVSPTSADLLLPEVESGRIDEVVVVPPMSSHGGAPARGAARIERLLRRPMTRRVDREIALLRAAGARVSRIEPTRADLAAMGANFMDAERLSRVRTTAHHQAPALVTRHLRTLEIVR
ncbi:patatin-like phospholipase family protein [Nocardioides convexus]|uniref:patatin-like phospholipase family protein n=1 Tax=Nocardioides convexus TaxID=2712224 RepID=UPI0024187755|nr:patatin-like phospholipase family protein [Nocardioides convexus]